MKITISTYIDAAVP